MMLMPISLPEMTLSRTWLFAAVVGSNVGEGVVIRRRWTRRARRCPASGTWRISTSPAAPSLDGRADLVVLDGVSGSNTGP